ncbi:hypothetical protein ACFL0A_01235 [Patescibacteria group bacterium]
MAITFIQKRKTQRYLILLFVGILLITTIVIWWGFLKEEEISSPETIFKPFKKVEINFEVLNKPTLEGLQLPEGIAPFEEDIGRENPFLAY